MAAAFSLLVTYSTLSSWTERQVGHVGQQADRAVSSGVFSRRR